MKDEFIAGRFERGKAHWRRKIVFGRRRIQLAVRKNDLQLGEPQHAGCERVRVQARAPHAPRIGMQRARELGCSPFVIGVLPLEMLRPQEEAFAPKNL